MGTAVYAANVRIAKGEFMTTNVCTRQLIKSRPSNIRHTTLRPLVPAWGTGVALLHSA